MAIILREEEFEREEMPADVPPKFVCCFVSCPFNHLFHLQQGTVGKDARF